MGATNFFAESVGTSAAAAFGEAVERAGHDHGQCGYTGSIAEKTSFKMLRYEGDPYEAADALIDDEDSPVNDKWGPAGCFKIPSAKGDKRDTNRYLFFGWASE